MRTELSKLTILTIGVITLISLLFLSACSRNDVYIDDKNVPKLPCKVKGACDATIMRMTKKFNKRGIKVISVGEDYLISVPATALFYEQTAHLTWPSYKLLNEIALYLKQFRKIAVNINSFSSKYVSPQREHALTLARSRVVSEYLWSQGIDSRLIFAQGLGSDKPITQYTAGGDNSPNARVEITFRDAVA